MRIHILGSILTNTISAEGVGEFCYSWHDGNIFERHQRFCVMYVQVYGVIVDENTLQRNYVVFEGIYINVSGNTPRNAPVYRVNISVNTPRKLIIPPRKGQYRKNNCE